MDNANNLKKCFHCKIAILSNKNGKFSEKPQDNLWITKTKDLRNKLVAIQCKISSK